MLSSHLCLGLPEVLFPVGLPVKILKALLSSSILATCPAHSQSSRFNHPERYKLHYIIIFFIIYCMTQQPLKSFDCPLMMVSLSN